MGDWRITMGKSLVLLAAAIALLALATAENKCKTTTYPSPLRGGVFRVPYGAVTNVTIARIEPNGECNPKKAYGICMGRACIYAKRPCSATFKYCYDPAVHCKYKVFTGAIYKYVTKIRSTQAIIRGKRVTIRKHIRKMQRMPGKKDEVLKIRKYFLRIAVGMRRNRLRFARKHLYPAVIELVSGNTGKCIMGKTYKLIKNRRGKPFLKISKVCLENPIYFNICFKYKPVSDIELK